MLPEEVNEAKNDEARSTSDVNTSATREEEMNFSKSISDAAIYASTVSICFDQNVNIQLEQKPLPIENVSPYILDSEKVLQEYPIMSSTDYETLGQDKAGTGCNSNIIEHYKADGLYSWIIVACTGMNLMCTLGVTNSFGVFSTYYINYIFPDKSAASIAWISTAMMAFMLAGAIATGPLTDQFGFRAVSLVGNGICSVSLILASFTTELWQLILTQGVMYGIGAACIYSPSISLPAQWHNKYRPLATGLAVAGSGAGGMLCTVITQKLMETLGHKWTLRILGLVVLIIGGIASLFYKNRVSGPRESYSIWIILRDTRMICIGMCGLFIDFAYYVPWYFLPTAALKLGQTDEASNNLVLYMNAGSTVGRVIATYFAIVIGPINSVAILYFISAVLVLIVLVWVKSMAGYIFLSVIYGSFSASYISINPLILSNIFGTHAVTTAVGVMNFYCAAGTIIGEPTQGEIYQVYDRPYDRFTAVAFWAFAGLLSTAASYVFLKYTMIRGTSLHIWSKL